MYKFKQPQYQSGSQIQQTNTLQYINTLDKCTRTFIPIFRDTS